MSPINQEKKLNGRRRHLMSTIITRNWNKRTSRLSIRIRCNAFANTSFKIKDQKITTTHKSILWMVKKNFMKSQFARYFSMINLNRKCFHWWSPSSLSLSIKFCSFRSSNLLVGSVMTPGAKNWQRSQTGCLLLSILILASFFYSSTQTWRSIIHSF